MHRLAPALFLLALASGVAAQSPSGSPPPPPPPADPAEPEIFEVVEVKPELLGGLEGLQRRVVYPEMARRAGIEGKVFVQFVVDEKGEVSEAYAVRCPNELLCDAAVKAVRESRFRPGTQRGVPVNVRFTLPVDFKLHGPEDDSPATMQALNARLGEAWSTDVYRETGLPASGVVKNGEGAVAFLLPSDPLADRVTAHVREGVLYALEVEFNAEGAAMLPELRADMEHDHGPPSPDGFFSPQQLGDAVRVRIDPEAGRMRAEHAPEASGERDSEIIEIEDIEQRSLPRRRTPPAPLPDVDEDGVYNIRIDQYPVLIGGLEGLQRRVSYPENARLAGVEGKAFVQFVVNEEGTVEDVYCPRAPSPALCAAAMEAVIASRFEPGMHDGRVVKVRFTLPVDFKLR